MVFDRGSEVPGSTSDMQRLFVRPIAHFDVKPANSRFISGCTFSDTDHQTDTS